LLTQRLECDPGFMLASPSILKQTMPRIWSTATGESLGTLDLNSPPPGHVAMLGSTDNKRLLALDVFPAQSWGALAPPPKNWFERQFPSMREQETYSTLLYNVHERREIARLPGWHARFSPNGRWLATADKTGRVRIWELPLRRPWLYIVGFASLAAVGCALTLRGTRLVSRWLNSPVRSRVVVGG
jgi:WD40 repeat protein